jgi:transposase-like protein
MARQASSENPSCPFCQGRHVIKNGCKDGKQRWLCSVCGKTFGPTYGTPLYGLRTPVTEVARSLLVVMRRGSLNAAEEITGHKYETLGEWLRRAVGHAEAITDVLVHELQLSAVEVDAFWSFVKKGVATRPQPTVYR